MTYRNEADALRERARLLEGELHDLESQKREAQALDGRAARVADELKKARTLLERIESKRALPMLEQIKIASPCNARWDEMVGDDRSRFCGKCDKHVYNLSAMSREAAELLVLEKEGNLCVRLYRRTDGTVLTVDCPVGVRKKRLRIVGVLAIGGGLAASAAGLASRGSPAPCSVEVGGMQMEQGDIAPEVTGSAYVPPSPPPQARPPHVRMGKPSVPSAPSPTSTGRR